MYDGWAHFSCLGLIGGDKFRILHATPSAIVYLQQDHLRNGDIGNFPAMMMNAYSCNGATILAPLDRWRILSNQSMTVFGDEHAFRGWASEGI